MFSEAVTEEQIFIPGELDGSVFAASRLDEASAVGVVTMGFSTDPVARWVYPDPSEYLNWFPSFIRAFAGRSFENGSAYRTRDMAGAALWLPPGVHSDDDTVAELSQRTVERSKQADLFAVFEEMGAYHPDEPHWYLPMIAVDGYMQGKGTGTKLMRHALARCDQDGLPAYLESTNPRNISLYTRFGFEIVGKIQVGGSPPIFPMLRTARGWSTFSS